jgi:hypothetical protein
MLTAGLVLIVAAFVAPAVSADPIPPYNAGTNFGIIDGPTDPEEYSWEVTLHEEQELVEVDDQRAAVIYGDGTTAFVINAQEAHDAQGASVPTSIAVSEGKIIILTVHHQAGNPAAGGAPFHYPIVAGAGWEGGFQSTVIFLLEPQPQTPPPPVQPTVSCQVPSLAGKSLRLARTKLKRSHCKLGKVRGAHTKLAKIVDQSLPSGTTAPAGSAVDIKLTSPGARGRSARPKQETSGIQGGGA